VESAPDVEGDDGPARPVYLYQCRAPSTSYLDCDHRSDVAGMTTSGHFSMQVTVHSRLYLYNGGSVDCLAEPCALVATSNGEHSEAGIVPLAFDPEGPVAPAPTVTLTPGADHVDGEEVTITAEHLEPRRDVTLAECPAGAIDLDFYTCHDVLDLRRTDAQGAVTFHHPAHDRINPNVGPPVDCREVTCSFVVTWYSAVDEAPRADLHFDPDVPARPFGLTATPTTGLANGQTITVTGRGYDATERIVVWQCVVGRRSLPAFHCGGPRRRATVDPVGDPSFGTTYGVARRFYANTTLVNCARRVCYLATVDDENGFVRGPRITFAP
jgi:hypothetical protein